MKALTRARQVPDILKAIVPASIRQAARTLQHDWAFDRAMKPFLKDPTLVLRPADPLLGKLTSAWGNEIWSALDEYLVECVSQALSSKGPILECGSGLTTVLIGAIAQRTGRQMWALEHTAEWGDRVQRALDRYGITAVRLCVGPLAHYGEFSWYAPPLADMPADFALVLCDGPPGDTAGGRYGMLPVMRNKLAPECLVLLDDASREGERHTAARWQAETPAVVEMRGIDKPYSRITLSDPSRDAGSRPAARSQSR